jgi:GNAT superfamily N-acetyltransferase
VATLRPATTADARDLTRLRGLMHSSMGTVPTDTWRAACEAAFARRLTEAGFVTFVVDVDGRAVCSGAGWVQEHLPSPGQLDGRRGHIASMSTDPEYRLQGHARAVFTALMGWFADQGISRVDLRATEDGRPLYESFGFRVLGGATMAWNAEGTNPGLGLRPPPG